jgi:hypothetical protein
VAGFALPVLIAFHIWLGRRQSKNGAAARSVKPAQE